MHCAFFLGGMVLSTLNVRAHAFVTVMTGRLRPAVLKTCSFVNGTKASPVLGKWKMFFKLDRGSFCLASAGSRIVVSVVSPF